MDYRGMEKAIDKQAFRRQRHYIPDAQVVVDVGAWVGQTVNGYRKLYPKAQIHAFEPIPKTCHKLAAKFAQDPGIQVHCAAMSDRDREGTQTLHINRPGYQTSLLETTGEYRATGIQHIEDIEVEVITLDLFCERHDIGRIDVLKLDVQGYELRVLNGARRLFDQDRVGLVFAELNFQRVYEGQCPWYDVGAWLAGYGFDLVELAPQWRQNRLDHANGLFFKEALTCESA